MGVVQPKTVAAHTGAVLLALATALIHLFLFLIQGFIGTDTLPPTYQLLFFCNFLAYAGLALALYLPALERYNRLVRVLLFSVAVASFISYLYVGLFSLLGHLDKLIEVVLIALLAVDANAMGGGVRDMALQIAVGAVAGLILFLILTLVLA